MAEQAFSWRGFMLDPVRHFIPLEDMRKLIRAAALCGMNRLHWHLTDDQGWRLEIRKYPKLTGVGAARGDSYFGGVSETEHNTGFYTLEQVREMVRFAGEYGIEVIPEIEIPGHASALLAAYPEYGCRRVSAAPDGTPREAEPWPYAVVVSAGIFPSLICPGKEETVRFLKDVLDEVMELFPFPMVHIGGDEAIKLHWRRCPDCQRRMRERGLADEDALQRDLVLEMGAYLAEHGRKTIVWNDVLEGGPLPPHFVVQQWKDGEEKTRAFMAQGGTVICSDTKAFYFDYPYGQTDVKKLWAYPRIPDWAEGLEGQLLGLECPLWSERITNLDRVAYLLFPRLAAAGLKASEPEPLPWTVFRERVAETQGKIESLGLTGAPETYWDMPAEAAEADRQAYQAMIHAPEAEPWFRKNVRLVRLEQTERFMRELGIPEAFILQAGDRILAEAAGREAEDDGTTALIRQLMAAVESRRYGEWKRFPEEVWRATMGCFPRFIAEHRRSYGRDGYDRCVWTVRQVECRLFRIGELEYELTEKDGQRVIGLHIPSDAVLEPDRLNESVRRARAFMAVYFPGMENAEMVCESWLLSPVLTRLLPPEARILRFQSAFDILSVDPGDDNALEWVFRVAQGQRETVRIADLPEETGLQRKMKALLLAGEKPGSGTGILRRPFA